MKIAMINGSPKLGKSNSGILLKALEPMLSPGNEIMHYNINRNSLTNEQYRELCTVDTLVIAFPLYDDGIPSHLFRMLITLQKYIKAEAKKEIYVYVLINNGFFEGQQCRIAMDIIKNWCMRSGLVFGQGIGHGAGEMLDIIEKVPLGHGPLKNLGSGLEILAHNIESQGTNKPILVSPNFPRFAWRFAATHTFWNATAKKNGLTKKDVLKRF